MTRGGGQLGAPAELNEPGTLRIGTIGGVVVLVRSSWLLIAVLIAYLIAPRVEEVSPGLGGLKYVAGLAFAVLLTLSLLAHEVSHALMAKRFGIPVHSITLHFIGGVTQIDGESSSPKQEFAISVVGPVTSLAVAGGCFALLPVTPDGLLTLVVGGLGGANLVIGILNLVPGLPLDGGRVLRALAWKVTGDPHRSTVIAGWSGRAVAGLMLVSPLIMEAFGIQTGPLDWMFGLVLGWFLWSAASSAIVSGRVRGRLPALQARALARRTTSVDENAPLSEAIRQAQAEQSGAIVTVDSQGTPVGLVNEASVAATPEERRAWIPVRAASRELEPGLRLSADLTGEPLIRAMQRTPATEYLLFEADGSLFGVLVSADVDAAFAAATGHS